MRHLKKPFSNEKEGTRTNEKKKKSWRKQKCKNKEMEIKPIPEQGCKVIIRQ